MSDQDSPRRMPRNSDSVSTPGILAIVLAVVAVVAGFLILNTINGETDTVTSLGNGSTSTIDNQPSVVGSDPAVPGSAATSLPGLGTTPPIAPPPASTTFAGASILVANANTTGGSAGSAKRLLEQATGFTVGDAVDATAEQAVSTVLFDPNNPAALPVAETLARVMGGLQVLPFPSPLPIKGEIGQNGVILMLGLDLSAVTVNDLKKPLNDADVIAANTTTLPPPGGTTVP